MAPEGGPGRRTTHGPGVGCDSVAVGVVRVGTDRAPIPVLHWQALDIALDCVGSAD